MGLGSLYWNVCLDRVEFVLMYPRFVIQKTVTQRMEGLRSHAHYRGGRQTAPDNP
jgi:hypothetical protein